MPQIVEAVLERSGYLEALQNERTIEAQGRVENLQELLSVAHSTRRRPRPSLASFLQEISLYSDQDALRGETSLVTLMTLHNAKGLEFRAVFLIGLEEGIFPHVRAIEQGIEEERRLCYVGMTRAKERLTLLHAASRSLWGGRQQRAVALPRRAAARARRARARLTPTSWSSRSPAPGIAPRTDVPSLATGDSVRHETLGGRDHADRGRRRRHRPLRRRRSESDG